jgi:DNA (cytosine-5)-methyltransferase 1
VSEGLYFDENDPFAADWLEALFPGAFVDRRSIVDVPPTVLVRPRRVHLFGGIGGWEQALNLAGFPADEPVWTGSCPCPPFSSAGRKTCKRCGGRVGFVGDEFGCLSCEWRDPRHLWPEMRRLVGECRPPVILGEQVSSKDGREWLARVRADLEDLGYAVGAADLCAAGAGAPHIRQRLFWVAHAVGARVRDRRPRADDGASGGAEGAGPQRQRVRPDPGDGCCVLAGGLAHAPDAGRGRAGVGPVPGRRSADESGRLFRPGGLAHADGPQRGPDGGGDADGIWQGGEAAVGAPGGGGPARGVEHPASNGRVEGGAEPVGRGPAGGCRPGGLGDAVGHRWQQGPAGSPRPEPDPGGPGVGFWSAFDVIPCRDGKARRVESGTFPLAPGVPRSLGPLLAVLEGMGVDPRRARQAVRNARGRLAKAGRNRVGRLRGYGNSIVPQVAAAFIRAYLDARADGFVTPAAPVEPGRQMSLLDLLEPT